MLQYLYYAGVQTKYERLPGSSYAELVTTTRKEFNTIRKRTKRQPYVRSKYFRNDKIFITVFWDHLAQKHRKDAFKRLKLYTAALDLLRNTTHAPDTIFSAKNKDILLHRFYGITKDGETFCVQVKEEKRSSRKDFMSVFDVRPQN